MKMQCAAHARMDSMIKDKGRVFFYSFGVIGTKKRKKQVKIVTQHFA